MIAIIDLKAESAKLTMLNGRSRTTTDAEKSRCRTPADAQIAVRAK